MPSSIKHNALSLSWFLLLICLVLLVPLPIPRSTRYACLTQLTSGLVVWPLQGSEAPLQSRTGACA